MATPDLIVLHEYANASAEYKREEPPDSRLETSYVVGGSDLRSKSKKKKTTDALQAKRRNQH